MKSIIAAAVETNLALALARGAAPQSFRDFMSGYCSGDAGKEETRLVYREYRRWYMNNYHRTVYPEKSRQIKLTLSLEEYRTLTRKAKKSGKKPAVFAGTMVLSAMSKSYVLPDERRVKGLEVQIRRIGNNINQIAAAVNSGKGFGKFEFKYLEKKLGELDEKISDAFRKPEDLVVFTARAVDKNPALIPRLRSMLDKAEAYFKNKVP